jgi:hypothetical protein
MAAAGEPTGRASDDDGWDLADELYKHGEKLGLSPVAAQVIAKAALDSGVVVPAAVAAEAQRERDEARAELERDEMRAWANDPENPLWEAGWQMGFKRGQSAASRRLEEAEGLLEALLDSQWDFPTDTDRDPRGWLTTFRNAGSFLARESSEGVSSGATSETCGRLLVGQGGDTWDPLCVLPKGHTGRCRPEPDSV